MGEYSSKIWVGMYAVLLETHTLFQINTCDLPYPILNLTQKLIPFFRPAQELPQFAGLQISSINENTLLQGPPSPKRPCAPRLLFYEFCVTRICFWEGFLSKSVSFGAILSKIVQKHAGIYSSITRLLFPGIILWLSWPNVFFFALTSSNMFPAKCCLAVEDTARLCPRKILPVFVSEDLVLWSKETDI